MVHVTNGRSKIFEALWQTPLILNLTSKPLISSTFNKKKLRIRSILKARNMMHMTTLSSEIESELVENSNLRRSMKTWN